MEAANTPAKIEGRGLDWSNNELYALAQATIKVCGEPEMRKQTIRKEMHKRFEKRSVMADLRSADAQTL